MTNKESLDSMGANKSIFILGQILKPGDTRNPACSKEERENKSKNKSTSLNGSTLKNGITPKYLGHGN